MALIPVRLLGGMMASLSSASRFEFSVDNLLGDDDTAALVERSNVTTAENEVSTRTNRAILAAVSWLFFVIVLACLSFFSSWFKRMESIVGTIVQRKAVFGGMMAVISMLFKEM